MSLCGTEGTCQGGLLGESNEFIQEGGTEGEAGKGSSVQHVRPCMAVWGGAGLLGDTEYTHMYG